jgi:hypothetical protein
VTNNTSHAGDPTVDTYKTCNNISCHYGLTPDQRPGAGVGGVDGGDA